MELSTYFRINAQNTGQFERTLLIADEGAYLSYLEGCTAPRRDENQLHNAIAIANTKDFFMVFSSFLEKQIVFITKRFSASESLHIPLE